MSNITASPETLVRQATYTADIYFDSAVQKIDDMFGQGYAQRHPELVGDYMQACCSDFATTMSLKHLCEKADSLIHNLERLADRLVDN